MYQFKKLYKRDGTLQKVQTRLKNGKTVALFKGGLKASKVKGKDVPALEEATQDEMAELYEKGYTKFIRKVATSSKEEEKTK